MGVNCSSETKPWIVRSRTGSSNIFSKFLALIAGFILIACQSSHSLQNSPESNTKYGKLINKLPVLNENARLINVPPNSTIWVCATNSDISFGAFSTSTLVLQVGLAVNKWADALGRLGPGKLRVETRLNPLQTCEQMKDLFGPHDGVIEVREADSAGCSGSNIIAVTSLDPVYFLNRYPFGKSMAFCTVNLKSLTTIDQEGIRAITLHEVGHNWGLCD